MDVDKYSDLDRLVPLSVARATAGISRSKLYELLAGNEFPQPVKIGRGSYFSVNELQDWIRARLSKRNQP